MDSHIVVYPHSGIPLSNKKEQTTGTGKNMHESQKLILSERNLKQKSIYSMTSFAYYEKRKIMGQKSDQQLSRAAGRESRSTTNQHSSRCWLDSAL